MQLFQEFHYPYIIIFQTSHAFMGSGRRNRLDRKNTCVIFVQIYVLSRLSFMEEKSDLGLNISHGSYVHNTHVVLRTLKEWVLQQITIRPTQEWKNHKIYLSNF